VDGLLKINGGVRRAVGDGSWVVWELGIGFWAPAWGVGCGKGV
jgi:hypothetical protein